MKHLVIVGKFQHYALPVALDRAIGETLKKHGNPKLNFVVGLSELKNTREQPFDFHTRKKMLLEAYNANVFFLKDRNDDSEWSKDLDMLIEKNLAPKDDNEVIIYGSEIGFVERYDGIYTYAALDSSVIVSEEEQVAQAYEEFKTKPKAFRAGLFVGKKDQYPTVIPCVDIAIVDMKNREVILARKEGEEGLRFIGGHADPRSNSYESDAIKEVLEETNLQIDSIDLEYIGNYNINDWRRAHPLEIVRTMFYMTEFPKGQKMMPKDDIRELHRVPLDDDLDKILIPDHKELGSALCGHINYMEIVRRAEEEAKKIDFDNLDID